MFYNLFCQYEQDTLKYFAVQLSISEQTMTEKHIAECSICCDTLAHLAILMFSEESSEETLFLSKNLNNFTIATRHLLNLP